MSQKSAMSSSAIAAAMDSNLTAGYLLTRLNNSHSTWEPMSKESFRNEKGMPGVVWAVTTNGEYFASHTSIGLSEYLAGKKLREMLSMGTMPPRSALSDGSGLNLLQRRALINILIESASVVDGLPGVGKTYMVAYAYRELKRLGKTSIGCAFTGSAASRLNQSTGMKCFTVHMLLGYNGDSFEYNEENPLPYDMIFLDEAGQIDVVLYWSLLRAIKPGACICHLGDTNQIGSVAPGNVLAELSKCLPTTTLTEIVRSDPQGPIGYALRRIMDGMPPESYGSVSEGGVFFRVCSDENIPKLAIKAMRRISTIENCGPTEVRSLAYTNSLSNSINVECFQARLFDHIPIIARQNNYNLGYFNGDTGVMKQDGLVDFGGKIVPMNSDLTIGYSSTINVSQGQQFRGVFLAISNDGIGIPNRNFSLTALTRAEKWVLIGGSFEKFKASLNRTDFNRKSLLSDFVNGSAYLVSKER